MLKKKKQHINRNNTSNYSILNKNVAELLPSLYSNSNVVNDSIPLGVN